MPIRIQELILIFPLKTSHLLCLFFFSIFFFRGHIEDVYDLSWSPDGSNLISGSVDNSAIIWDVMKGVCMLPKDSYCSGLPAKITISFIILTSYPAELLL